MEYINFEWDENKNQINKTKHGIDFEEASTVFYDDNAIMFDAPEHSMEEERFLILGIPNMIICALLVIVIVVKIT